MGESFTGGRCRVGAGVMAFAGVAANRFWQDPLAVREFHEFETTRDDQATPAKTLGDVLYGDATGALVTEEDWVALVRSIAGRDQVALHALYERAHRVVFTLIFRITGDRETAEEVTLDVFHDVWRSAPQYDPRNGTVLGWIMNQARSRALDRIKYEQRKKRTPQGEGEPAPPVESAMEVLEAREQSGALKEALQSLTPDERQAIETAFFSEITYAEVAARLNEPPGTIKTRIRSGLHKLRQALETWGRRP